MRAVLVLAVLAWASPAAAGTLDRVRAAGVLHCAAAERAGFAGRGDGGEASGVEADLCRSLAHAVLGPDGRASLRLLDSARSFDEVATDDVVFLTAAETTEHALAPRLIPGPVAYVVELTALTQPGVDGLAGRTICFMSGDPAHQALEAWATRTGTAYVRSAFQEEGEMHDAFDARRCDAMAGEAAELAEFRAERPGRAAARILPPLGVAPVFAAVATDDGAWAGMVFWAIGALVQSETAPNPWRADLPGTDAPGLRPGWLADAAPFDAGVRAAYAPWGLRAGANAPWPDGLLLPPGPR